jgi:hypothetical protein
MSPRRETLTALAGRRSGSPAATLVRWLLAAVAALPLPGAAAGEREVDEKRGPEVEVGFPPFPQDENLLPFAVSATSDNRFMVDGNSLSVAGDGIVRYTVVIVSPAGARNVSYEAMNCMTGERRLHALGRPDETWVRARSDQWLKIRESSLNRYHAELFTNYFCPLGTTVRDADELRSALQRGGHPAVLQR